MKSSEDRQNSQWASILQNEVLRRTVLLQGSEIDILGSSPFSYRVPKIVHVGTFSNAYHGKVFLFVLGSVKYLLGSLRLKNIVTGQNLSSV